MVSLHVAVLMFAIAIGCMFIAEVGVKIAKDAEAGISRLRKPNT